MTSPIYRFSPALVFLLAVLSGLGMSAVAIWVALAEPQIDLPQGASPIRVGAIELIETDLIEEPDQLGAYDNIRAFNARQSLIRAELDAPAVDVAYTLPDGSTVSETLTPRTRVLADLPGAFWFQHGVALFSMLIGGWVLGLRPGDWGARMFAATAVFVPVFALPASIYSTRQIALDGELFRILSALNVVGAVSFGIALVGLFAMYPKPLFRPVWLWVPAAVFGVAIGLGVAQVGPDQIAGMAVLSEMLIALVLGVVQWIRSRREPLNRAGLRWFILVSLVGCSLFIFLSSAPVTLGLAETGLISQGYAFGFFNLMHIGLALGVLRYKVFNLDRWSYYIWLWLSGMVMVFALDILLIRLLQTQPWVSLGVALLLAGVLYFPLRQLLLTLLLERRSATISGQMAGIVNAALSPSRAEHDRRWDTLLSDVFDPLAPPERIPTPVAAPRIDENGLSLLVPGVDGLEPRRLRYAQKGRRLFSLNDIEVAGNLVQTHNLASESRQAYERGAILERDRISRDIHDNIGAQLLSALHSPEIARKDDLLRDSLADLRAIINDGFLAEYPLPPVLADLRTETAGRLDSAGLRLRWTDTLAPDATGPVVAFELVNGLRSILREAVSNILRHAGARTVWVSIALVDGNIELEVEDDGRGVDPGKRLGNGIPNIVERARALAGQGSVGPRPDDSAPGTRVWVCLPLNVDAARIRMAAQ